MARLSLVLLAFLMLSCVSRKDVEAVLFLHDQIPAETCDRSPELRRIGIYRKVTCTPQLVDAGICKPGDKEKTEFLSYCKSQIRNYFGAHKDDVARLLKQAGVK